MVVYSQRRYQVIRYFGEILNDTTIHFTSSERIDGSEYTTEDLTYHFKQFGPKPDSVASFISTTYAVRDVFWRLGCVTGSAEYHSRSQSVW